MSRAVIATTRAKLIAISLFACAVTIACGRSEPDPSQADAAPAEKSAGSDQQAADVAYIELQPTTVELTDQLPARVVSYKVAEIRPQVSGIIESRLFTEGSFVEEGQQLYQIDSDTFEASQQMAQANLERAEALANNAQRQVNRYRELITSKAISQQEVDNAEDNLTQAKAGVSVAKAELRAAEVELEYTKVYAPISGYISTSSVTKGALVTALQATALATVRQLDPVYVDISQSVTDSLNLQERLINSRMQGSQSDFAVTLLLGQEGQSYATKGQLEATDLAVDRQTGAIKLRAVFPNPDTVLLPGMFVSAMIEDVGRSRALVVPQKSVAINPDGSKYVWVANSDDTAEKRQVQAGISYRDKWVISSGLKSGDRVLVEGTMMLREGTPLKLERLEASLVEPDATALGGAKTAYNLEPNP